LQFFFERYCISIFFNLYTHKETVLFFVNMLTHRNNIDVFFCQHT